MKKILFLMLVCGFAVAGNAVSSLDALKADIQQTRLQRMKVEYDIKQAQAEAQKLNEQIKRLRDDIATFKLLVNEAQQQ